MVAPFVAVLVLAQSSVTVAAPDPANPEAALDFFLGEWRTVGGVPQKDGSYTKDTGRLIGARAFHGGSTPNVLVRTIQDSAEAGDNPFELDYFESVDLYVYHAESATWRGISHNTLGNRKWREVTVGDGTLSFIQTGELFGDARGEVRFHYYAITKDHFEMRVDHRPTQESEWTEGTYRMRAERIVED